MTYEVVAVHINGGQDQTGHEHNQAEGQAAQAVERRLPGPQGQNQFLLILGRRKQTLMHDYCREEQTLRFCRGLNEPTSEILGTSGEQQPESRVVSNAPASPGLAPPPVWRLSRRFRALAAPGRALLQLTGASIGKSELWKDFMEARHSAPLRGGGHLETGYTRTRRQLCMCESALLCVLRPLGEAQRRFHTVSPSSSPPELQMSSRGSDRDAAHAHLPFC